MPPLISFTIGLLSCINAGMSPYKVESIKIRMTPQQKEMLKQAMGLDMSATVIHLITTAAAKL
ncbi:MAG: hypothetical protein JZU65_23725 [Chlorobium sp.]|nr:hypothetical protein [Chlorobium sp.]